MAAVRVLLGLPPVAPPTPAATASTAAGGDAKQSAPPAPATTASSGSGSGGAAPKPKPAYPVDEPTPEWFFRTALHRASADGASELVELLLAAGANPLLVGDKSQTPYQLAGSKKVRTAFETFALENLAMWDYAKAQIPVHGMCCGLFFVCWAQSVCSPPFCVLS